MVWLGDNFHALTIIISLTGLILSIVGGFFALLQWKQSTALKRAEIIKHIVDKLRYDKEMASVIHMVEYNKFKYTIEFHKNPELEQRIDGLLAMLDYVCYLRSNNILRKKEFTILKHRVVWILKRKDIQTYLWNLYHFTKHNDTTCSFQHLIDFGLKNKLFPNNFENSSCDFFKSKKFLNFK